MDDLDALLAARAASATADPLDALLQQRASGQPIAAVPAAPVGPQRDKFDLRGEGFDKAKNYSGKDAIGGWIRGAGSFGATLLRPFESAEQNAQRRTDMDQGLQALVGSDPNSMAYHTNKLLAEVAGTSGVGGAIVKALRMIPGAAAALPTLLPAIESGGMAVNGEKGAYALANRVAGGAVNGAATAGFVDPKDAKAGAFIGAATAPVSQGAAIVGEAIGKRQQQKLADELLRFQKNAPKNEALQQGLDAGYVVPPATVNPSFTNRIIESISGKQATQQLASVRNSEVTDKLVRQALGVEEGAPLTREALEAIRKEEGKAYAAVANLPVRQGQSASSLTNAPAVAPINPKQALEDLKQARNDAQGWFASYNRSASPEDLKKAKAAEALAQKLDQTLEQHAMDSGKPDLVQALRDARVRIAKSYTVERALNPATGTVDPNVFAKLYQKGKPLSDGLDTVGRFASAFPTVNKLPEKIGTPDSHNLKAIASMLGSVGGAASMGPVGALTGVIPLAAPPVARSIMFSNAVQKGLVQQAPKAGKAAQLAALLQNQAALENAIRSAPVAGAAYLSP